MFDADLRRAIAEKRLIQVSYKGKLRVGRGWKLLDAEKIAGCIVLDEMFSGSRSGYDGRHLAWDAVYARVNQ